MSVLSCALLGTDDQAEDTVEAWEDHFKDLQNLVMSIFEEAESKDGEGKVHSPGTNLKLNRKKERSGMKVL